MALQLASAAEVEESPLVVPVDWAAEVVPAVVWQLARVAEPAAWTQVEVAAAWAAAAAAVEWRLAVVAEAAGSPPVALEVVLAVEVAALA